MASFNIQFGGPTTTISEIETTQSQLQEDDDANKIVNLVNEVIDTELGTTEVVDIDNDGSPDYQYEYVYYYYDDNGVNGTLVDVKPANSLTKLSNISAVNIHTNSGRSTEQWEIGFGNHQRYNIIVFRRHSDYLRWSFQCE